MVSRKKPLDKATLDADIAAIGAIADYPEYAPYNPAYSAAALQARVLRLLAAERAELIAREAYELARIERIAAGYDVHEGGLGLKTAVLAQFGPDARIVKAVGLKPKSEYKRPRRRAKPA